MKNLPASKIQGAASKRAPEPARTRILIPVVVSLIAGAVMTAAWFSHNHSSDATTPVVASLGQKELSDATKAVLQHLDSPVEIHFYSVLDPTSVPQSVQEFSGRVDQLLSQYQDTAGNRIRLVRCNAPSAPGAKAAQADGIRAFNIDKGDSCFLGIAVVCGGQKESLSQLDPQWEQAVEPDLTRAIARVIQAKAAEQTVAQASTATLDAVKRTIPNLDTVSLEDGTTTIRNTALLQFKQAADDMDAKVQAAEQEFAQAENNQSESAQQAATEKLQQIKTEGMAKLKEISMNSHAQIAALQQLKKSSPATQGATQQ